MYLKEITTNLANMTFDFTGKKILITGVGRGIGKDLAIAIVKAGGIVYGISRQKVHLDATVAECPGIIPIQVDLADWDATRKEALKLPVLDGLVNNAGICPDEVASVEASKEMVDKTMSVNLMGALNLTQVVAKKMMESGKAGSIVNVSSTNGLNAMLEYMAYNLSKAALDMMTRQFALELGPHNIRVNSVNPTVVFTDMGKEHWSDGPKATKLRSQIPMGRFLEVHEIVGPIMYLLSEFSTMVTGTMNPVEGGLLSHISV